MLSLNFFKRPPARPGTMIFYNTLIKSFLYMGLVMLCILALRRTSASIRHMVRAVVLFGLLLLPLSAGLLPTRSVPVPNDFPPTVISRVLRNHPIKISLSTCLLVPYPSGDSPLIFR